jgi:hypothetical protein
MAMTAKRSLLTLGNPKTEKGTGLGFLTAILHLAPADRSGRNVCPWASPGCIATCLNLAGRGGIFAKGEDSNAIQRARIARTEFFFADRPAFLAQLRREIRQHVARAARHGLRPAARLNGTSDIPWESIEPALFEEFSAVVFYDYTKAPHRIPHPFPNYSLTFSRSETNEADALATLARGGNVAVVFDVARGAPLPATWNGYPVHDADVHDLRFLDPAGSVAGLRAKGPAKRDNTGFVVRVSQ